jgi:Dolichyl-phosphate-mannose-protein mannosyltransferase
VTSAELAERTGRARSFGHDLVSAIPAWGWVAALVCVSAGTRFAIAQRYPGPWIFHDEVAYSDLGRSLGRTGSLAIRDVPGANGFGVVYPVLIAPAYALFGHVPRAYEAARAINALVMSLAAVPVYLLARRLVRPPLALLAAVLALALPAMAYTTAMMTENAFYPAFTLVVLAMYLALERPTILRQLLVFPAILIAFYTRTQGIVFLPALVTGVVILCVLDAWLEPGGRFSRRLLRGLAAYWVTWAVALGGAVLVVLYEHARGRPLSTLLGAYGGVTLFQYHVVPIARWFVYHLGELDFAVGVLPFAAFLYVVTGLLRAERSRPLRVFAAVSVPVVLWFTLAVAAYASNPVGDRIEERNLFFVATLFFVALVVWVDRGLPRRSLAAGAAILAAVALAGAVPYGSLINDNSVSGAFGLLPLEHLEHWRVSVAAHDLRWVVIAGAVLAGLFLLVLPRRYAPAAPLAVLAYLALASHPVYMITEQASVDSAHAGISVKKNWVDRAAGADANVAILFFAIDAVPFWQNEFFNASVRTVYNINGRYDGLPQTQVGVDSKTAFLVDPTHNRLVHSDYLLVNQSILPRGRLVAEDPGTGMRLFRTPGRYVHIDQIVSGVYPDTWSGPEAGYQRYACKGGTLTVTMTSDPALHPYDQVVTAIEANRVVARKVVKRSRDVGQRMTVPLKSQGGDCGVRFTITPSRSPDDAFNNGDKRVLGIRFTRFVYRPR